MSQTLEELVSRWTIEADLQPLDQAKAALEGIAVSLGGIAATVGAAAAGLFGIAKETAEAGHQAEEAAIKFGLTAQAFQQLQYAAGPSVDALNMGLLFLNRNMGAVAEGSKEAAKVFSRLGISAMENGKLRDTNDVLMDLADKFHKMPNDASRTRAAVELFGRSGAGMLPFLTKGRDEIAALSQEAVDFGFVIQDTEAAHHFEETWTQITNIFRGLRNMVGEALIPVIQEVMDQFKSWIKLNKDWIVSNINFYVGVLLHYIQVMTGFLKNMWNALSAVVRIFGGWKTIIVTLTVAFAAFTAIMALWNIGRFTLALVGLGQQLVMLANVFRFVGAEAVIAQLKVFAFPLLIGALVVAALLALEDLYTFFSGGGDTITGDFVAIMKQLADWVGGAFKSMMDSLYNTLLGWSKVVSTAIMGAFQPLIDMINWVMDKASKLSLGGIGSAIKGLASSALGIGGGSGGSNSMAGLPDVAGSMGLYPSFAPAVGSGTGANMQQSTTINQTINAGDGASALEVGKQVGNQTDNVMDRRNRQAARTFSAQGDW